MVIAIAGDHQEVQNGEYYLKPGYIFLAMGRILISTVVGSCVAICLWDRKNKFGGMSHFLYPIVTGPQEATAKYGNVGTLTLIRMMVSEGSEHSLLEAQLFGGGDILTEEGPNIGRQNVEIARKILNRHGIPIVSEDVGGSKGRKLIYDTGNNQAVILKVDRIRQEDWYPYRATTS